MSENRKALNYNTDDMRHCEYIEAHVDEDRAFWESIRKELEE